MWSILLPSLFTPYTDKDATRNRHFFSLLCLPLALSCGISKSLSLVECKNDVGALTNNSDRLKGTTS